MWLWRRPAGQGKVEAVRAVTAAATPGTAYTRPMPDTDKTRALIISALPVTRAARPVVLRPMRALLLCALGAVLAQTALAQQVRPAAQPPSLLPPAVQKALQRARIPENAVAVYIAPVGTASVAAPRLQWQATRAMNPASVMKLVTTYAALDILGPAYTWQTQVYVDGPISDGTLHGNLYIRGGGDPQFGAERLWQLLARLQGMGVRSIAGDVVVDRSAFALPAHNPGAFDGEPLRPYNAGPDALLVNFKSQLLHFMPDEAAGVARIHYEPPLTGVQGPQTVPLAPAGTACGDWRGQLRADWSQPRLLHLLGHFPASCGTKTWPLAPAHAGDFALRAIAGMWHSMGGSVRGVVRQGTVPEGRVPSWVQPSLPLADVLRGINKYSNNVMTQQVLLTLGMHQGGKVSTPSDSGDPDADVDSVSVSNGDAAEQTDAVADPGEPFLKGSASFGVSSSGSSVGTFQSGRAAIALWWKPQWGQPPVVDNGAGLSRDARISAQALGRMLQAAWAAPVMPEFVASLPIAGVDGTLRRSRARAHAHLKTGSLRNVNARAGYVTGNSGQRYAFVVLVNHANAAAARTAMDILVDWTAAESK